MAEDIVRVTPARDLYPGLEIRPVLQHLSDGEREEKTCTTAARSGRACTARSTVSASARSTRGRAGSGASRARYGASVRIVCGDCPSLIGEGLPRFETEHIGLSTELGFHAMEIVYFNVKMVSF